MAPEAAPSRARPLAVSVTGCGAISADPFPGRQEELRRRERVVVGRDGADDEIMRVRLSAPGVLDRVDALLGAEIRLVAGGGRGERGDADVEAGGHLRQGERPAGGG